MKITCQDYNIYYNYRLISRSV